ncbi:hypothetical protein RBL01_010375 [Enterococcus sp. SB12]|nr:hypothetical protein [Enterococcus sp. SB12]MDQ4659180.1 hypothetical protein [Enterococcus sp. SB12]
MDFLFFYPKYLFTQNILRYPNNYFYAFVEFKGSVLTLYSFQGLNRNIVKEIPMNEIETLTKDIYWGGQRISFSHEGKMYQFFECGPAVVDYLQENLFV